MSDESQQLGGEVVAHCRALGFALAGVSDARATEHEAEFRDWLAAGKHGSMSWLARNVEERMDPTRLLPGVKSVVMVGDVYASGSDTSPHSSGVTGRIARYARGEDYHEVIKKRLHALCDGLRERYPAAQFRAFVDTAPVLEREHAVLAELGWIGKHTLLIHPDLGSWMLLGGVLTTLELLPPESQRPITDHCGTCTRCIDACPTKAITPYSVDARRCISYLTIERRETIPEEFHEPIGAWLFGCDICQEVCPHNRERQWGVGSREWGEAKSTNRDRQGAGPINPAYTPRHSSFDLLEVLGWTEEDRRTALARSAMKRAKLDMWKRNALIVAGNALRAAGATACAERQVVPLASTALRHRIEKIARDEAESEMVRNTARAVLKSRRAD